MKSFHGLWNKEWKMTRVYHFILISLSILVIALSYWGIGDDGLEFVLIPIGLLMVLHIFYLPGYLLYSFAREGRMLHAWLHSPQSIHQLTLVKFLNGLVFSILSLTIVSGFIYWIISEIQQLQVYMGDIGKMLLWLNFHSVLTAIYFGVFLYLLWSLRHFLNKIIGGWSWLITIASFVLLPILLGWLQSSNLYVLLTKWGYMGIEMPSIEKKLESIQVAEASMTMGVHAGTYLFHIILTLLMYFLASYILDRKVEV